MTTQTDWLPLSDPDMSLGEIEAITEVLKSPRFSPGAVVEAFEAAFAVYIGRAATPSPCRAARWAWCWLCARAASAGATK